MVAIRPRSKGKGKRSIPPSRVKYEQGHPTVTVRVSRELRDKLTQLKEEQGLSVGDVLRMRVIEATELQEAYDHGFGDGYEEAKEKYEVTYWCSHCRRRHLSITGDEAKEAAAKLMYEAGWHSTACPER